LAGASRAPRRDVGRQQQCGRVGPPGTARRRPVRSAWSACGTRCRRDRPRSGSAPWRSAAPAGRCRARDPAGRRSDPRSRSRGRRAASGSADTSAMLCNASKPTCGPLPCVPITSWSAAVVRALRQSGASHVTQLVGRMPDRDVDLLDAPQVDRRAGHDDVARRRRDCGRELVDLGLAVAHGRQQRADLRVAREGVDDRPDRVRTRVHQLAGAGEARRDRSGAQPHAAVRRSSALAQPSVEPDTCWRPSPVVPAERRTPRSHTCQATPRYRDDARDPDAPPPNRTPNPRKNPTS